MNKIIKHLGPLCPPLRLILSSKCNGACYFCHREGLSDKDTKEIEDYTLEAAVSAAEIIGLNKITISGGEPTLLDNLPNKLNIIKNAHPNAYINIVTNGYNLKHNLPQISNIINNIDLSVVSFSSYSKFTGLSPHQIVSIIESVSRQSIPLTINTIIIDDNINDVPNIIKLAIRKNVSITLMMPHISMSSHKSVALLRQVIDKYQINDVTIRNIPVFESKLSNHTKIRIKLPELSGMIQWGRCIRCENRYLCTEFFCAIRVTPDGNIHNCIFLKETVGRANTVEGFINLYLTAINQMVGESTTLENLLYIAQDKNYNQMFNSKQNFIYCEN